MELLSGATLEDRINTGGRLKPEEVDRILWPLLDGLEQVHAAGFLHRDIKPANILLDANGNPTLIDFGASRAAMVGRTAAMTAIFTPGYAAAEQMTSAKQGPWTDIYGLAATIYHAIAGKAPPNAFDRMLDDGYEPLARIAPPGFSPGVLAGIDAGLTVAARDRPQSISGWRPILGMSAAPEAGATMVMARPEDAAAARVSVLGPATPTVSADALPSAAAPRSKAGLWVGIAAVVLLALGGGGYYAMATRGPDPEIVKARAAAEAAEEARRKADEEADKLRAEKAEQDAKVKAEQDAKAKAALEAKQKADAEAAKRQFEEDTRRKVEAEIAEKKRAADEAQRKADEEAAARQKAIDDARKATEFVAGNFDHFGKTLMLIGLKDRSGEIRLQGVDSVDDPALHKLAADALAAQPRNLRCRQTDRLTDGTPLYRCLITKRAAKEPLGEIPDSDRDDLALVLVRTGLLLASCDAPRSYADAEDDARGSKQYLWSRVTVPEYKRRCTR